jgi:hypothetical protein
MKNKFDEEDLFDQAARDAFKNFELPFEAQDWKRMEKALDEKKHRRLSAIWWYKSLEVLVVSGVFSVLLYTAMPNSQITETAHNQSKTKNTATTQANTTQANNTQATNNDLAENNDANVSLITASQLEKASQITYSGNSSSNAGDNMNSKTSPTNNNTEKAAGNIYTYPSKAQGKTKKSSKTNSSIGTASPIASKNTTASNNNNVADNNNNSADNNNNADAELLLPRILANHLEAKDVAEIDRKVEPEPDFGLKKLKPLQPYIRQIRIGLLVGAEAHSRTEYGRGAGGYTIGVIGEGEFSKTFALQAGLQMSLRSYEQERTYTVDNTQLDPNVEGLIHQVEEQRHTQAALLQVPIQLQITCFKNDKWRIYAQTGANFYLNLSQSYSGTRQTTLSQAQGALRFSTDIAARDYEGAFFQTGSLQNNAFVNLQIGIGIERQLTDRLCLFVQPNFQYSLTKINQYGNKNNIISLNVGAKTNF